MSTTYTCLLTCRYYLSMNVRNIIEGYRVSMVIYSPGPTSSIVTTSKGMHTKPVLRRYIIHLVFPYWLTGVHWLGWDSIGAVTKCAHEQKHMLDIIANQSAFMLGNPS